MVGLGYEYGVQYKLATKLRKKERARHCKFGDNNMLPKIVKYSMATPQSLRVRIEWIKWRRRRQSTYMITGYSAINEVCPAVLSEVNCNKLFSIVGRFPNRKLTFQCGKCMRAQKAGARILRCSFSTAVTTVETFLSNGKLRLE